MIRVRKLHEAKNIRGHKSARSPWLTHSKLRTAQAVLAPGNQIKKQIVGSARTIPRLGVFERTFRQQIQNVLRRVEAGSPPSIREMTTIFRSHYYPVFKLGLQAGGEPATLNLSAENTRWLESFLVKELGFWKKFLEDIRLRRGKMSYAQRAEMYVQTLRSIYHSARVIASPPNTVYYWVPGPAEHCPQCLFLASHGPYTKANLPTVPGTSDTVCKTNCRCRLRAKVVSPLEYLRISKMSGSREKLLRDMRALVR